MGLLRPSCCIAAASGWAARLAGAIAYLTGGWTLFDGTIGTARAFDERVAAAGSGFTEGSPTMAITAAILSA